MSEINPVPKALQAFIETEAFRDWLTANTELSYKTVITYGQMVRKYIETGDIPTQRVAAAVAHYTEFSRSCVPVVTADVVARAVESLERRAITLGFMGIEIAEPPDVANVKDELAAFRAHLELSAIMDCRLAIPESTVLYYLKVVSNYLNGKPFVGRQCPQYHKTIVRRYLLWRSYAVRYWSSWKEALIAHGRKV